MPFNIADFRSEADSKRGMMRTNKFLISFVAPTVAAYTVYDRQTRRDFDRKVEFWCESVNLPGYALQTHDTRRYSYGPIEKRPFGPKTVPLLCNFLGDSDGHVFNFFNTWLTNIIPHHASAGINGTPQRVNSVGGRIMFPYEVRYKKDYITDVHVYVFDEYGKNTIHVVCREAFPAQIMDLPLSWGNSDNAQFQIVMEYLDWYQDETLTKPPPIPASLRIFNGV